MSIQPTQAIMDVRGGEILREVRSLGISLARSKIQLIKKPSIEAKITQTQSLILQKIQELGTALTHREGLSATLLSRVHYLGSAIDLLLRKCLEPSSAAGPSPLQVSSWDGFSREFMEDFTSIKNILHVEAAAFMIPVTILHERSLFLEYLSSLESKGGAPLSGISSLIPDFFERIQLSHQTEELIFDISNIIAQFDAEGLQNASVHFDWVMLEIVSAYKFDEGKIYIPLAKIPDIHLVSKLLSSRQKPVNTLGQLFLIAFQLRKNIVRLFADLTVGDFVFEGISKKTSNGTYPFDEYKSFYPVVPFMSKFLELRGKYLAQHRPFKEILASTTDCAEFAAFLPKDLTREMVSFYDYFLALEEGILRVFSGASYQAFLSENAKRLSHPITKNTLEITSELKASPGRRYESPIPSNGYFCTSAKDFESLLEGVNLFSLVAGNEEKPSEKELPAKKVNVAKKKSPKPKEALKRISPQTVSAAGYDYQEQISRPGTPFAQLEEERDIEEGFFSGLDYASSAKATSKISPLPKICDSHVQGMSNAKAFLDQISLHPRVSAWFKSIEAGLKSRGDQLDQFDRDSFIVGHHFPHLLLNYVFYDKFTRRREFKDRTQFDGILLIDGQKYILEASVNKSNELFHFFARKVSLFSDYLKNYEFSLTSGSNHEFPPLASPTKAKSTETSFASEQTACALEGKGEEFCDNGNIKFSFAGRHYELIYLGQF